MSGWFDFVPPGSMLQQGDILYECPVFFPNPDIDYRTLSDPASVEFKLEYTDVIVMTQSCDIQQGSPELSILLCPIVGIEQIKKEGHLGNLVNDKIGYLHLLNKHESGNNLIDYKIVDFRHVFTIPLGVLNNWKISKGTEIPRLRAPYAELMAQRFAIKLMRIGTDDNLKVDLSELKARWATLRSVPS
ncbi:hypothetical protein [Paenibacillus sp. 7541]|uniref:hypothetical protein n=1 Tax=Paenibacillus sp. 7541 TaxID=2026236 RepID=UPI000BA74F78|nr:hypothetical protein [Paenibacillus sp. 7541]PAK51403.1 hypothetical protein CHH75_14485 [Paenibacillus sp. 7541]